MLFEMRAETNSCAHNITLDWISCIFTATAAIARMQLQAALAC